LSLTRQLVWPVVGLLLAAVLANVGFAAWLAARRSADNARAARDKVADTLAASRVSLSPPVLDALRRLTGNHFIVWNETDRQIGVSTLPREALRDVDADLLATAIRDGRGTFADRPYHVGGVRASGVRPETVLVLTPDRDVLASTLEAVWPVLAVAATTLAVLVPLGVRATRRLAGRITAVERHVGRIAQGEFGQTLATAVDAAPADEIGRLVLGVDRMSRQLGELRESLVAGERQRLLGQLAAGFAHELRNAVTGARLAIDLHRRRCAGATGADPDESLGVAIRQLDILEEEVRGLLALGKPAATAAAAPLDVDGLLAEVRDLTAPRCAHAGVRLECGPRAGLAVVARHDAVRAALVNLALNGIDAAGRGGHVHLAATARGPQILLTVADSGPGPPTAVRDTMQEPFVTSKPEGIGLGLAVARAVAEGHGGALEWDRSDGTTRFAIALPARTPEHGPEGGPATPQHEQQCP
jgi:signal transduction histidine kinase